MTINGDKVDELKPNIHIIRLDSSDRDALEMLDAITQAKNDIPVGTLSIRQCTQTNKIQPARS